jgi:hypothetical protein
VEDLFGVALGPDEGLAGFDMPGAANAPQAMRFDADRAWWSAEGIPIAPVDDAGATQPYPLMRLTARDGAGRVLATTDIVLPVSSEMDCRGCHASTPATRPHAGWVANGSRRLPPQRAAPPRRAARPGAYSEPSARRATTRPPYDGDGGTSVL